MSDRHPEDQHGEDLPVSKTARKREMTALQALGEALCELSPRELASIPIDDPALLEAIEASRTIRAHGALRRHRQYIGKLMRDIDPAPIQSALDALHQTQRADAAALHELEAHRDALLARGDEGLETVLERFPHADRQHLRQLVRQARSDPEGTRGRGAFRKLLRYLRELQEG